MADLFPQLTGAARIAFVIAVVVAVHLAVTGLRHANRRLAAGVVRPHLSKTQTVASLTISTLVFLLYFGAIGLILNEFGISLTAYLASASIVGLAIGFGSQGVVQDVVTGLTVIFSDLFDLGDLVEIAGQTGIVDHVGMRFTILRNPLGAAVYIPNRSIANVINYPSGYVRCLVDVTLTGDAATAARMQQRVDALMATAADQFPGILRAPPDIEGRLRLSSGREVLRVKFRIWPGRGGPIETSFRQELLQALREIDEKYADWMVAVNYEIERKPVRAPRPKRT